MGSTKVSAPAPSQQEVEIARLQLEQMQKAIAREEALEPFLLQSLRLIDTGGGVLRRMTDDEYFAGLSPTEQTFETNLRLAQDRERKALMGELPLSEAGQQRKRDEFLSFREAMARQGTPVSGDTPETAVATSTSGIQSLKAFNERWGLVEEAERRGELTAGTSAVLARMGVASDIGARTQAGLLTFPQAPAAMAQGFSGLLQPYQFQRQMQFQAGLESARNRMGLLQGAGMLAGTLGAAYMLAPAAALPAGGAFAAGTGGLGAIAAGGAAFLPSARKFKKDVAKATRGEEEEALETVRDLDGVTYRYKGEGKGTPRRMGLLADTAPEDLTTPDGEALDVGRVLGKLQGAVKALARKVDTMEGKRRPKRDTEKSVRDLVEERAQRRLRGDVHG